MGKIKLTLLALVSVYSLHAQQMVDLEENTPYVYNGLEYGFSVTNERSKEVKGEDYDRYEISLYVANKSGCIKLIPFQNTSGQSEEERTIAMFNCINATGKRLTSKSGKVNARPMFTQVKVTDGNQSKFINAQVGFGIKNGQIISNKIVVIVPKGEKPKLSLSVLSFPEI